MIKPDFILSRRCRPYCLCLCLFLASPLIPMIPLQGCDNSQSPASGLTVSIESIDMSNGTVAGRVMYLSSSGKEEPLLAGTLDASFNDNGLLYRRLSQVKQPVAISMAIQPGGRILVAGVAVDPALDRTVGVVFAVTPEGVPDPLFNNGLPVLVSFEGHDAAATDIAVLEDGRIIVLGNVDQEQVFLRRYSEDGDQELEKFIYAQDSALTAGSLVVQEDQRIVVYMNKETLNNGQLTYRMAGNRFNADLEFDQGFYSELEFPSAEPKLTDVALQPDGKFVATGYNMKAPGYGYLNVRFLKSGGPDTTYDIGIFSDALKPERKLAGKALALQADGKIVIVGEIFVEDEWKAMLIARQLAGGNIDLPFGVPPGEPGGLGAVAYSLDGGPYYEKGGTFGAGVAIQENQKILALGQGRDTESERSAMFVMRLDNDGIMDSFFGEPWHFGARYLIIRDQSMDIEAACILLASDHAALVTGTAIDPETHESCFLIGKFHTRGLQRLTVQNNYGKSVDADVHPDGAWTATLDSILPGTVTALAVHDNGERTQVICATPN